MPPVISTLAATPVEIPRPMKNNPPRKEDAAAYDADDEEVKKVSEECREVLRRLPRETGWRTRYLYFFQNLFWCQPQEIQAVTAFQKHFSACDGDVFLATIPKSGTTWLKALTFAVINRRRLSPSSASHPLITANPHDLVPFLEYKLYAGGEHLPDLDSANSGARRVFATHVPYSALPDTITTASTNTKIIYLCRNPLDTFVSSLHYVTKITPESGSHQPLSVADAFEKYRRGVVGFGPFWDHMLGYWNQSLKQPNEVLFLKYEDMKDDISASLKAMAAFIGVPFSREEEEEGGVVEEIARLCSFEKLKDLEVNKKGKSIKDFENKHLFRKGQVGDWVNYLSSDMANQLTHVMEEKFRGSGLHFRLI